MRRYLTLFVVAIIALMSPTCLAMKLESSTELGSIATLPPSGAFRIEGAVSNEGILAKEKEYKSGRDYARGVACFGSDEDALYVHYDNSYFYTEDFGENVFRSKELVNSCRMGDSDIANTIVMPLGFPHTCTIYQINNDTGTKMYLLQYDIGAIPSYKMIGKRQDGNWVKYFETTVAEQYYGMKLAFCHNYRLDGNSVIFEYGRYSAEENKFITNIELQFIWNDEDQWFGVEIVSH